MRRVKLPDTFLTDSAVIARLADLIGKLSNTNSTSVDVDGIYSDFCSLILSEIPHTENSRKGNRHRNRRIVRKKWWDEELSLARLALREACKAWLKEKHSGILKVHYAQCQKDFNRLVRQKKRNYWRNQRVRLLLGQKKHLRKFWKDVKGLGLSSTTPKSTLPFEVILEDGSVSSNEKHVMHKWYTAFKSLLNPSSHALPECSIPCTPKDCSDLIMNQPITMEEVTSTLKYSHTNKL